MLLRHGTEVVQNAAINNYDSCWLPHHGVGQTKDTIGVTLDPALTFEEYVNNVVKAFNFHMWDLRQISRSISRDVANTMAACIVDTRLDYCNALLYGVSEKSLNKLQIIQNNLARVVYNVITLQ